MYGDNDINISDAVLEHNQAETDGGAIYINDGSLDFTWWWVLRWNYAWGRVGQSANMDQEFQILKLELLKKEYANNK